MADDYMDAHMGREGWTTPPGAADEGITELKYAIQGEGAQQTEPVARWQSEHSHPGAHQHHVRPVDQAGFDELIQLRAEKAYQGALLVDMLTAMEEMNSMLNQHAAGGRHPQTKAFHLAAIRAARELIKRSHG